MQLNPFARNRGEKTFNLGPSEYAGERLYVGRQGEKLTEMAFRLGSPTGTRKTFEEIFQIARSSSWTNIELKAPRQDTYQSWMAPFKHFADLGIHSVRFEVQELITVVAAINSSSARVPAEDLGTLESVMKKVTLEEVKTASLGDSWLTNFLVNIWDFANGSTVLQSKPWNITLPVADLCNARCTFCTSWIEGKALIAVDKLAAFSEVIENALLIGLVGHGEPLAHPQFDKLCEIISRHMDPRSAIYTITNGVYLKKWAHAIKSINLRSISISLNAATPETHNEIMGLGSNAFTEIIDSIRSIMANNPQRDRIQVYITMVITQQNLHEVGKFIELGNALGVTGIWLRSLLPQSGLVPGLNYHTLSPILHPEFARLKAVALKAIAASKTPVQAEPQIWDTEILPESVRKEIERNPPEFVTRDQALKSRELRRRNDHIYNKDVALKGRAVDRSKYSDVKRHRESVEIVTPSQTWSYAYSVPVTLPNHVENVGGRVKLTVDKVVGKIGIGLLDKDKNEWIARAFPNQPGEIELAFSKDNNAIELVVENAMDGNVASSGSLSHASITVGSRNESWTDKLDLERGFPHNPVDPYDDGENPFFRKPRFECRAVYYNLYVNEMFYRIVPCCYMTIVPGFEEIRFDGSSSFMEVWNSPALVTLREHLKSGPLFGACKKCSEKW